MAQLYFDELGAAIRWTAQARIAAEPHHLEQLVAFAERAYRRPMQPAERDGLLAFYRELRQSGLGHEDAIRDTVASVLVSPHVLYRVDARTDGRAVADRRSHRRAADRLRAGQPPQLLPLVQHARRGTAGARRRGRSAPAGRASRAGTSHAARRPHQPPRHRVRHQLARRAALRGIQQRRSRALPDVHQRAATRVLRGARAVSHGPDSRGSPGHGSALRRLHVRQPAARLALRDAAAGRTLRIAGSAWTRRAAISAAACCRWPCS